MFQKLRTQLTLTIVCVVSIGLVVIAMAVGALLFTTSVIEEQAERTFAADVNSVLYYLNSQTFIDQVWLRKTEANSGLIIRIDIQGSELLHTARDPQRKALTDRAQRYVVEQFGFDLLQKPVQNAQPDMANFCLDADGRSYRAVVATVTYGEEWAALTILKDTAPENTQLFRVRLVTALCLAAALVVLVLFSYLFIGYTLKPIERNRRRQTEFVSAASHELRSPLAVISASAGAIKRGTPQEAQVYADKIEAECVRLSRLTGDLLMLAAADSGSWQMHMTEVSAETLVIGMAERFEELAAERGITLKVSLPATLCPPLYADEHRIEQVLAVLLDNALGYTPRGGSIELGAAVQRRQLCITVRDSGPGVPNSEKEQIFNRFYRGDGARTDKEHFGIGLAVAREIAQLHRGSLQVRDAEGGGAIFVLKLPCRKDA